MEGKQGVLNPGNRLYCGDCKAVLMELIAEGVEVDLIYLDPPFNSDRNYNLIYKSPDSKTTAQQVAFHDMWGTTEENAEETLNAFVDFMNAQDGIDQESRGFLAGFISSLRWRDVKTFNYLVYIAERVILMKRVLKDTGSIYFHCDPTASHYIKIVMDGVFGADNFRREVIWSNEDCSGFKSQANNWVRGHDVLLYYVIGKPYFNKQYLPRQEQSLKGYNKIDNDGRRYKSYKKEGGGERRVYLDSSKGRAFSSVWKDIVSFQTGRKKNEYLGYPTQKPIALLDRIIKASCPEGGIVLDPFCGCGTAVDSAIMNGRSWIGIDKSDLSIQIIKDRIKARGIEEGRDFTVQYIRPDTWEAYDRLDAYAKQDFLVQSLGGLPSQKKSGDDGVDGELTIHKGIDKQGNDVWGKVIFSVKSGSQNARAPLDELAEVVRRKKADIGVLLVDKDPSLKTQSRAEGSRKLKYQMNRNMPPEEYNTLQIYTAMDILEGVRLSAPPSMLKVQAYRKSQKELFN